MMTAAQLVAPGRFELLRTKRPDPAPGQVRVALDGCGVCASNLPAWAGRPWFQYPLAPGELGHEGWGRVEAVGAEADRSLVGTRVATISERAYAEADLVAVEDLISLPEHVEIAPLEPYGCVFNVADRADLAPAQTVAVVGLGFIGLGVVRLAVQAGARVIGISTSPSAREAAKRWGASDVLPLAERAATGEAVAELTKGAGCDRVVECTGHQGPLDLAGDLVATGGRLVIAGFHQDGPRRVDLQQWNWKGIDVINAHERSPARIRGGMRIAADALAADPDWVGQLITERHDLASLDVALDRAARRPDGFVKAAVLMSGGRA